MADQSSAQPAAKKTPSKKTAAKKTAKKETAKKSPAKKSAAKRSATKKSAAKKATTKKAANRAPVKKTAATRASRLADGVKDAGSSAAASGMTVVAKATAVTRKPVEAGKALVGSAGDRVVTLSQAVAAPSAQFLAAAQGRAKQLVADPAGLRTLADRAIHSASGRSGPLGEVVDDFKTLGRLVAAYSRGDYRDIPIDSLLTVIAGLVYVVSPLDLIPESVPVAGVADDAVAIGFVIRQVHHELTAFREWEATTPIKG